MIRAIGREQIRSFGDAVFAVIITIMVLQLRTPDHPTFQALFDEWPTVVSYAVSYMLIAIMWLNHHFLLRFATDTTPRLVLWTFVHMFAASLVPFATAWIAVTRLAPVPTFVYAAVIVFVNLAYHAFAHAVIGRNPEDGVTPAMRRRALARSVATIAVFAVAMMLALWLPIAAFALVTCVVLTYAHPNMPGWAKLPV